MIFGAKNADVVARRALLDALDVLQPHLDSLILVGAQAVYLHTNHIELPLAPATTDSDIIFDTRSLADFPEIGGMLRQAGYQENVGADSQPGRWISAEGVPLDLFQPSKLSGRKAGSRGAHIHPHEKNILRIAKGLDCVLVDNSLAEIVSFEKSDSRKFKMHVAGAASLLIAKTFKILDRADDGGKRLANKDAHDVYRLLVSREKKEIATSLVHLLNNQISADEARVGFQAFKKLFAEKQSALGNQMAAEATIGTQDEAQVQASLWALALDLVEEVEAEK